MNKGLIKNLFPEFLRDHEYYNVFVELTSSEFNNVMDFISVLTSLSNVDRCPEEFIKHLGDLIGFNYSTTLDTDMQRECMKYFSSERKSIGSLNDLEMMATYGDIEGYKGGNMFIPGTFEPRPKAIVVLPREQLFTWCKSKWSGEDKLAGDIVYKEGTILIEVTRLNNFIKDRVEQVKPAGMLIVYKYVHDGKIEYITHERSL